MYIVTGRTEVLDFKDGRFHYGPYQDIMFVTSKWDKLLSWEISNAKANQITDSHNRQDDISMDMVQLGESSMDLHCEDGLAKTDTPEVQEAQDQSNPEPEDNQFIQFIEVV